MINVKINLSLTYIVCALKAKQSYESEKCTTRMSAERSSLQWRRQEKQQYFPSHRRLFWRFCWIDWINLSKMPAPMPVGALTMASFALTAAVIGNAYYQKKQFYPSVVYITKSNPSMAVSYYRFCFYCHLLSLCFRLFRLLSVMKIHGVILIKRWLCCKGLCFGVC